MEIGQTAPDFALRGIDDVNHELRAAFADGPVLLVFFKTKCKTTGLSLPYLDKLHRAARYGREPIGGLL